MGESVRKSQQIFDILKASCKELKLKCQEFTSADFYNIVDSALDYLAQHRVLTVTLLAIIISCVIPYLAFLLVAGILVCLTFFIFFAIEGTIIIFGFLALLAATLILLTVVFLGLVTAVSAWVAVSQSFTALRFKLKDSVSDLTFEKETQEVN